MDFVREFARMAAVQYNKNMKLNYRLDKILFFTTVFLVATVVGAMGASQWTQNTYAKSEDGTYIEVAERFVTFFDDGEKLTVRTNAVTVGEALTRAGIEVNAADIVEPSLATEINSNNFFINIYRARPVVVRDGVMEKYIMTASYDPRTIAEEAGLTVYDGDVVAAVMQRNFLETGAAEAYELTRNGGRQVTVEEEIAFSEREVKDYNLQPGVREVRQLGEVGRKVLVYEVQYVDGEERTRELLSETVAKEPVERIVAVGASEIERTPLTAGKGRNRYTVRLADGRVIERQETYYDLDMSGVMRFCGAAAYSVREDGVKVDPEGYVIVAADLSRYPRCSVVETSLGLGKVYDTGAFVATNPEQFDIATDWSRRDGV